VEKDTVFPPILFAIEQLKFPIMQRVKRMDYFEKPYRENCTTCS